MGVKNLVTAAILALAAICGTAASAQVYGTNDDPYQQNPFASNMNVPEPAPAPAAPVASPGDSATNAPATPPDSTKTQQAAASIGSSGDSVNAPAKKPALP